MPKADERSPGDRLGQDDGEVRAAIRFAVLATAAAVGFVVMAALWVSTCPGTGVDTVACGAPQRTLLAFGGPLILLAAGLWAFVRTYRVWRSEGTWWGWHGAGWFLLTLMIVTVSMGVPAIAGPVLAG
ncbi:hypothetical protein [Mycobacterium montefiorense]|uniref:Transmembrane protein n=1 Tax=Mycobacterium montefiorense TaxID=154654 RepID=A0AA37PM44_9MYCO|nr:hypothetical protein [Mycobacterium montefiorense]GBG37068.1 hypothetical protein MmonteBS_14400 [Mycobacterium montefiorense]GKU36813.1 hypothetical protein NJB14191_41590 [Mycobacterium montefiorense]GKU42932.1 hypothetical protein NJB14192_49150 [Mycobacterium montefiorense]GKU48372.1 hypothetical protein NJB14194_49870 [Mycobacterium montefiorense]GKU50873.1 hypothetical protein NJB14195_21190 [Mycobacterium montefiorense]